MAHDGEMEQVGWSAFDTGPRVQQHKFIFRRRDDAGNSRTIHARNWAQTNRGSGDQPAGITRRNQSVGRTLFDQIDGTKNRTIFLAAQAFDRLVLHRQHFAGVNNPNSGISTASALESGLDLTFIAHKV